jgi:hypothetical protein
VTTPEGGNYYMPTEREQYGKHLQQAVDLGKLDIAKAIQMQNALLPFDIAKKEAQQRYEQQYAPPVKPELITKDAGDVTAIDPFTGATKYTKPGAGKSKTTAENKAPNSELNKFEDLKTKSNVALQKAQNAEALLRDPNTDEATRMKAKVAYQSALNEARLHEQAAKALGQRLKSIHKDKIEYGEDAQGNPYIKWNE